MNSYNSLILFNLFINPILFCPLNFIYLALFIFVIFLVYYRFIYSFYFRNVQFIELIFLYFTSINLVEVKSLAKCSEYIMILITGQLETIKYIFKSANQMDLERFYWNFYTIFPYRWRNLLAVFFYILSYCWIVLHWHNIN